MISFRRLALIKLLVVIAVSAPFAAEADDLVLRNLRFVKNCRIETVDVDGIHLDREVDEHGKLLPWDLIHRVTQTTPDPEKTAAIATFQRTVGVPLAKLKARLHVADHHGGLAPAEELYQATQGRVSPDNALALVGLFRGNVARGRRELAVLPAVEYLRVAPQTTIALFPGKSPSIDPGTGLLGEMPALFIDSKNAPEAWPPVEAWLKEHEATASAGAKIYAAALAIAAGQLEPAEAIIKGVPKTKPEDDWAKGLLECDLDIVRDRASTAASKLIALGSKVPSPFRSWHVLLQGRAMTKTVRPGDDVSSVLLNLLRAASKTEANEPELAAACLEQAIALASATGDKRTAESLKSELTRAFPKTIAAQRVGK